VLGRREDPRFQVVQNEMREESAVCDPGRKRLLDMADPVMRGSSFRTEWVTVHPRAAR
jgi:hypothetical protein